MHRDSKNSWQPWSHAGHHDGPHIMKLIQNQPGPYGSTQLPCGGQGVGEERRLALSLEKQELARPSGLWPGSVTA